MLHLIALTQLEVLQLTIKGVDADDHASSCENGYLARYLSAFTRLEALCISVDGRVQCDEDCELLRAMCLLASQLDRLRILRLWCPALQRPEDEGQAALLPADVVVELRGLAARLDVALVREFAVGKYGPSWQYAELPAGIRALPGYDELDELDHVFAADRSFG